MNQEKRLVVFTDLDGTLLDHQTYQFEAALPALEALKQLQAPIVLNSSKTQLEMETLRLQLGNNDPFAVENGAALIIPQEFLGNKEQECVCLATDRQQVLNVLGELRQQGFVFTGFNDMSVSVLAQVTGLSEVASQQAKQRVATEPLLWEGTADQLDIFRSRLRDKGLQLVQGGRFYHVMGQYDKADAMRYLMERLHEVQPTVQWISVALGDSLNDLKMLEWADFAVVIKGVNSEKIPLVASDRVIRSDKTGPWGWNESVLQLLKHLNLNP